MTDPRSLQEIKIDMDNLKLALQMDIGDQFKVCEVFADRCIEYSHAIAREQGQNAIR